MGERERKTHTHTCVCGRENDDEEEEEDDDDDEESRRSDPRSIRQSSTCSNQQVFHEGHQVEDLVWPQQRRVRRRLVQLGRDQ